MSREKVIEVLGEPLRSIVFGNKTIVQYADINIELKDDKVVEVKVKRKAKPRASEGRKATGLVRPAGS